MSPHGRGWLIAANDEFGRSFVRQLPHGQGEHDARGERTPEKKNVVASGHRAYREERVDREEYEQRPEHLPALPRTEALQPVRLGRDEVERVDVLMGLLDERTAKQG